MKKYHKALSLFLALLMVFSLFTLTGCMKSEKDAAVTYVEDYLKLIYTGEVTDDFLTSTGLSPARCLEMYNSGFDFVPTSFCQAFAIDLSLCDDDVPQRIIALYKDIYKHVSFHVSYQGKDGDDIVLRVKVYPLDTLRLAQQDFDSFVSYWADRNLSGELDSLSGREYENLWANAVLEFVEGYVARTRTTNNVHTVSLRLNHIGSASYTLDMAGLKQLDYFIIK